MSEPDVQVQNAALTGENMLLRYEIERLRGLLREAADDIEHWGGYASEYFKDKWHLKDDIKKYRDAAGAAVQPNAAICNHEWTDVARCVLCNMTYDRWVGDACCEDGCTLMGPHDKCNADPTSEILSTTAKGG